MAHTTPRPLCSNEKGVAKGTFPAEVAELRRAPAGVARGKELRLYRTFAVICGRNSSETRTTGVEIH